MARPDKEAAIAALTEQFRSSGAVLLTEYRGLSVAQLKTLRRSLAGNARYAVVKNTLAAIAAREAGFEAFAEELHGPTAIAFVEGEAVDAAKALRDFAKVDKLASLESREVLLAKTAGAVKASLSKAAYLFAAPASKAVRTVDALREKQEQAA